jgi:hypothetical protein
MAEIYGKIDRYTHVACEWFSEKALEPMQGGSTYWTILFVIALFLGGLDPSWMTGRGFVLAVIVFWHAKDHSFVSTVARMYVVQLFLVKTGLCQTPSE